MSEEVNIPRLQEYVSIKDAAKMLGLSYKSVHEYVMEGRIPAVRTSGMILISVDEVKKFKPNISGRPRKSIPKWRISPKDNTLSRTSIKVNVREGQQARLFAQFEVIRLSERYLFPGTVIRYISGQETAPQNIEIVLIWRSSVMPDASERERELEAFRQALVDVLDWDTAQYEHSVVFMHT